MVPQIYWNIVLHSFIETQHTNFIIPYLIDLVQNWHTFSWSSFSYQWPKLHKNRYYIILTCLRPDWFSSWSNPKRRNVGCLKLRIQKRNIGHRTFVFSKFISIGWDLGSKEMQLMNHNSWFSINSISNYTCKCDPQNFWPKRKFGQIAVRLEQKAIVVN